MNQNLVNFFPAKKPVEKSEESEEKKAAQSKKKKNESLGWKMSTKIYVSDVKGITT